MVLCLSVSVCVCLPLCCVCDCQSVHCVVCELITIPDSEQATHTTSTRLLVRHTQRTVTTTHTRLKISAAFNFETQRRDACISTQPVCWNKIVKKNEKTTQFGSKNSKKFKVDHFQLKMQKGHTKHCITIFKHRFIDQTHETITKSQAKIGLASRENEPSASLLCLGTSANAIRIHPRRRESTVGTLHCDGDVGLVASVSLVED